MVDNFCPVESGEPDEPLFIQAAESRLAVAIGLWIGGICWTGIVALIGMGLLQNREWIPLLSAGSQSRWTESMNHSSGSLDQVSSYLRLPIR